MIKKHSYLSLPNILFSVIDAKEHSAMEWVLFNHDLANELNIDSLDSDKRMNVLDGSDNDIDYFAQAYAGHQFGHFTILGDGRALNIGEVIKDNTRYDIQLKGSGPTPYSRGGDGKATLYSMLREYLIGEALHALNIPTSRTLSILKTGETVQRTKEHTGAIASRIARSHLRIGTFQYAFVKGDVDLVKTLADYAIEKHYPENKDNYYAFFHDVLKAQAKLIAKWQSIGFIHGVLNTDNVLISGESIDFGPCAFMDYYYPNTVFSSIDRFGRYKYSQQPIITSWNLSKLAETLFPLFDNDKEKAINKANELLKSFEDIYTYYYNEEMRKKLGLDQPNKDIIDRLLTLMENHQLDFTNTFIKLTTNDVSTLKDLNGFSQWYQDWKALITDHSKATRMMQNHNPRIIPRNHIVEEALNAFAFEKDDTPFNALLELLKDPFNYTKTIPEKYQKPNPHKSDYVTYCGT